MWRGEKKSGKKIGKDMGSIFALQQNLSLSFLSPSFRRLLDLFIFPQKMDRQSNTMYEIRKLYNIRTKTMIILGQNFFPN